MTANDLDRIEKELKLVLPRSYREFMQSGEFGKGYEGTQDLTGVADEVIEATKEFRDLGFYGTKWPNNYLVIGDDGAGDCYFTDVQKERPAVFFADHELTANKNEMIVSRKDQYQTFTEFWEFIKKANEATGRSLQQRWWQLFTRKLW